MTSQHFERKGYINNQRATNEKRVFYQNYFKTVLSSWEFVLKGGSKLKCLLESGIMEEKKKKLGGKDFRPNTCFFIGM